MKDKIYDEIKKIYYSIIHNVILTVLFISLLYIMVNFFSEELKSDDVFSIVQGGAVITATLALLSFTYALVINENNEEKKDVIKIGKNFLKSTLDFIIGIIFLVGVKFSEAKSTNSSDILDTVVNLLGTFVPMLLFLIALSALIFSIVYFALGILNLLKIVK